MTSSPTCTPLCALVGVTKRFGGITACQEVTFEVRAGEVHALVGENGAGKSTLMKLLHGLYQADEGQVEVDGRTVAFASPRDAEAAGIAMIPQELDLFPDLSVTENLFVGRPRPRTRWGGFDWRAMANLAEEAFASLGVALDVREPVQHLSVANSQLVGIARALVRDARVVIMDEPTAALTELEAERLFRIIRDLGRRGVGVVYISHRLEEIFKLADRITVLRDGHHVWTGCAQAVTQQELIAYMVGRPLETLFPRTFNQAGETVLEVRHLGLPSKFHDVSFTLRRGEVVGLAGLIGAGRTELAQAVFGVTPARTGSVLVHGHEVHLTSPDVALRHGLTYVPEERRSQGLVLSFSINHNVSFASLGELSTLGFVRTRAERALAEQFVSLLSIRGATLGEPVSQLSGGNQQKVVVAKALARRPDILLLDEPTRGVDVGAKVEIYRIIDQLAQEGRAILLISSELNEVLSLSDRILVMREGRLVAEMSRTEATPERVAAAATSEVPRAVHEGGFPA